MPPYHRSLAGEITRVLWRVVLFGAISAGVMMAAGRALMPVFPSGLPFGRPGQVLYFLMIAVALGLAHLAAAFWEKSGDWAILGFAPEGWNLRRLAIALPAGIALVLVPAGVIAALGLARVQTMPMGPWGGYALNALVLCALVALAETLAYRGYLYGLLERRWGAWVAVGVTALLFTAMQLLVASMTLANVVGTFALGAFLGAVRARAEGVAAPWLAQLGLLWAQGALLHSSVRGLEFDSPPLYRLVLGPPWAVTGAGWGLTGGLLVALCLGGATYLLMRPLPFVPPPPARP